MAFPLILPLAATAVKTSASVLAWYWSGAAALGAGAGTVFVWFRNRQPVVDPIQPAETALHAMKEKIEDATVAVLQNQCQFSELDEQAQAELEQAKIAYEELRTLFEKLKSGLGDAKELEETIERISKWMGNGLATLDILQQKILELEKKLRPMQKYSFFSSSEFKQLQSDMKSMVEGMMDRGAEQTLFQTHSV